MVSAWEEKGRSKGRERNGKEWHGQEREERRSFTKKKKKIGVEGVARGMPYKVQARIATVLKKII